MRASGGGPGRADPEEQEADSEELEWLPEKQTVETLQPPSRDFSEMLTEGVGTAGSRQRLLVSHGASASPTAGKRAPSSMARLFFGPSSFAAFSASKMHTQWRNMRVPGHKAHPPVLRIWGVLPGKH